MRRAHLGRTANYHGSDDTLQEIYSPMPLEVHFLVI